MPKADGKTLQERFNERYRVDPKTGCWNWTAGTNSKGYAYLWIGPGKRTFQAYKLSYVWKNGPVPKGLELHHTCDNPLCVNPDHLEAKTHKQHQKEHTSLITTINALKTKCKRGHEFTKENTRINKNGARACRACARGWRKRKLQKKG